MQHKGPSPVVWSDQADEDIKGDLTAAVAYVTPAGGAVVTGIASIGIGDRAAGTMGFTTSLGLHKKLERILRDPRVAMAYHARDHGYSSNHLFVLAQGLADVDLTPSREKIEAIIPQVEKFLGEVKRGRLWDRLLHEYYFERVFVDVRVVRVTEWPNLDGGGSPRVSGDPQSTQPGPQTPPRNGTAPRVKMSKVARQVSKLPHRVIAFRGSDGFPVIVPVKITHHGKQGFTLAAAPGLLPAGGRRAGLLAHSYHPKLVGIATRSMTGWLEVTVDGAGVYSPHTCKGWSAPAIKSVLLVMNGLLAKFGYRKARRDGVLERLEQLRASPTA